MNLHDWSAVSPDTFHGFHTTWIVHLTAALNDGVLPEGYYAMPESHIGYTVPDLLTLGRPAPRFPAPLPRPPEGGAVGVAERPPRASRVMHVDSAARGNLRTVAVRHQTGHRLIAIIEIVSAGNKRSRSSLREFVGKVRDAFLNGVHAVVLDVHPAGRLDPQGPHGAIWAELGQPDYERPADKPLTFVGYDAGEGVAYVEPLAAGDPPAAVPLFLAPDLYVDMPAAAAYAAAFQSMARIWRNVPDPPAEVPPPPA